MNEGQLSQTKKAKAARQWRYTNRQKKRFDGPLREYIKIKYNDIYGEYVEFYNLLDKKYPHIRDLSKTRMFKKWAKGVREESSESEGSQSGGENEVSVEVQSCLEDISYQNEAASNQLVDQEVSQPDILSIALQETLPEVIPDQLSVYKGGHIERDLLKETKFPGDKSRGLWLS